MKKIIIINGPNINMLEYRDKNIYSGKSYNEIIDMINSLSLKYNIEIEMFQSNNEGDIINKIQELYFNEDRYLGLIINPAAYSHYSLSIADALELLTIPKIEVHISNIFIREDLRKNLITAAKCDCFISGLGIFSYELAIEYLIKNFKKKE